MRKYQGICLPLNHSCPGVISVTKSWSHRRTGQNPRSSFSNSTASNKLIKAWGYFLMLVSYPVGHILCLFVCVCVVSSFIFKKCCLESGYSLVGSVICTRCLGKIIVGSQLLPSAHDTQASLWVDGGQRMEAEWVPSMFRGHRWCIYSGPLAWFIRKISTHILRATRCCSTHTAVLWVQTFPLQSGNWGTRNSQNLLRIHVTRIELNKPGSVPWKADVVSPCPSIPLARCSWGTPQASQEVRERTSCQQGGSQTWELSSP